jgi:hypothetical protein
MGNTQNSLSQDKLNNLAKDTESNFKSNYNIYNVWNKSKYGNE